ncbi:GntR family transcriptional regulator [Fimbriimonas ginsengisoli]|uniref:Transcriptional regulator, GntR family n=1 Tax=Fimbriimonas ginsengisoli Gsoil 348 TaxID=661478 RepID=A0A068NQP7_FIMGI|nr:GntR family transcriptional regulator [Fimbriimonas ginsengisoli]AIE85883.1 transcriptional regulator, GntR family [Fimbriimonas ginsengisoli Gsoil 348]
MRIHISPTDGVPIYLQIVQQVRRLVAGGELMEGEELPSIRSLAERLVVNPNTVSRAYRELETGGVVVFSRGLGTFVAASDRRMANEEKRALLAQRLDSVILEGRQMGVTFDELLDLMRERGLAVAPDDQTEGEMEVTRG